MAKHILIYYHIKRQGGLGHPDYREIVRGPTLFILHIPTEKLYEHIGTDHINYKITAEQVEDKGLIRLVLGDSKAQ